MLYVAYSEKTQQSAGTKEAADLHQNLSNLSFFGNKNKQMLFATLMILLFIYQIKNCCGRNAVSPTTCSRRHLLHVQLQVICYFCWYLCLTCCCLPLCLHFSFYSSDFLCCSLQDVSLFQLLMSLLMLLPWSFFNFFNKNRYFIFMIYILNAIH